MYCARVLRILIYILGSIIKVLQAIEEKFILDVLKNYPGYQRYYKISKEAAT